MRSELYKVRAKRRREAEVRDRERLYYELGDVGRRNGGDVRIRPVRREGSVGVASTS